MFLAKNDDGVAMRLLDGEYEPQSMKVWTGMGDIRIDVGAHTGIYTLNAWKTGKCFSIEPYFMNYARLIMNLKANDFPVDHAVFGCASSTDGVVDFGVNTGPDYLSTGGRIGKSIRTFPVKSYRLDTLIANDWHAKITGIKIDVENHCKEVLKGMAHILEHKPKILFECTEEGVGEILGPLGYKFFLIDEETGLEEVKDLVPEMKDGKPVMTRLNRYCEDR